MGRGIALALAWALALGAPAAAQRRDDVERIPLRVSGVEPGGRVVVDRGASDRVASGDLVILYPREGGSLRGSVTDVRERDSVVVLHGTAAAPPLGTRGEVRVPSARFPAPGPEPAPAGEPAARPEPPVEAPEPTPSEEPAAPAQEPAREAPAGELEWEDGDEGWRPDMPLLAQVGAVRPEQRAPSIVGRAYLGADQTFSNHDYSDSLYRLGGWVLYENPFGQGGGLNVDAELNQRATETPIAAGDVDESKARLRVDRLSYYRGGTRFEPTRWEVGRFLHHGVPELGGLDGFEWSRRRDGGDRWGASAGWLPEPNESYESLHDFQISAWYEWTSDRYEELALTGAVQKTWHGSEPDRDLLIGKVRYLPLEGWDLLGTAWVDLYGGSDDTKDSSVELTQALVTTSRTFDDRMGLTFSFDHHQLPELLRHEFTPTVADDLADGRYDRVGVSAWRRVSGDKRLHARAGVWNDEDETGGDAQFGLEVQDLFLGRSTADVTMYALKGEFSYVAGTRVTYGRYMEGGRWDLMYELADHRQIGFSDDRDDIFQHRFRASSEFYVFSDWSLSVYGEGRSWDSQDTWTVGFHLERGF